MIWRVGIRKPFLIPNNFVTDLSVEDLRLSSKLHIRLGPGGHSCNGCYSGGRDQENRGWKLAWATSSVRPYLEKTLHKKGLEEWLQVKALSSNPISPANNNNNNKKPAHQGGYC
jgi:hypothetical protein